MKFIKAIGLRDKLSRLGVVFISALTLAACGGGGDGNPGRADTSSTPAAVATLSVALSDGGNAISAAGTTVAQATVKDASGALVDGKLVTFSADAALVKFTPDSGQVLTVNGVASIQVLRASATAAGAGTLSAQATVGTAAVSGKFDFQLVAAPVVVVTSPTLSLALGAGGNSIAASGSTLAQATVKDGNGALLDGKLVTFSGDPALVKFNPASGQVLTVNGVASIQVSPASASAAGAGTLAAQASVASTTVSSTFDVQVVASSTSAASAPTLSLALSGGGNSVAASGSTVAQATLKDASGALVDGKLVTFAGDAALVKFSPASGQVLTVNGVASVQVSPSSLLAAGAGTLSAQATVAGTKVSSAFDFQMAAANLGLQSLNLGSGALAAYGNRAISVMATVNGVAATNTPVQVTFSASCGSVTPAVVATDATGVANSTYSASLATCAGSNVTVTAAAVGTATVSGMVAVTASTASNVQFVSVTPQVIYLKDSVGATQGQVVFKVVDSSGNPLQNKKLRLSLGNSATGVSLNSVGNTLPVDLTSDSAGLVTVAVFAGTVPTSLNVRATLLDAAGLATSVFSDSNLLTVASGRPTPKYTSLALDKFSIEGMNVDGQTANLTFSMADRQGNPVPPGTQVNFVTEAGVVQSSCAVPAVTPAVSYCSVTLSSQGTRTTNGRVSVLAYVAGEEDFVDLNANNVYDSGESFTDLGRAFRDDNGSSPAGANGTYDAGEFQVPRIGTNACVAGVGCAGDGLWGAADVRRQATVVFASSSAVITSGSLVAATPITGSLPATNGLAGVTVTIADTNGNSMPTGTKVGFVAIDDGAPVPGLATTTLCALAGSTSYTVPNSLGAMSLFVPLSNCTVGDRLQVKVTSPLGIVTENVFSVQ